MATIAIAIEAAQIEQYKSVIVAMQGDNVTVNKSSDKDAPGILWGSILDYLKLGYRKLNNDLSSQLEKRRIQHILKRRIKALSTSF
jgi:hypothetical protein